MVSTHHAATLRWNNGNQPADANSLNTVNRAIGGGRCSCMNTRKTTNLVIGLLLALVTVASAPAGGDESAVRFTSPEPWQVLGSVFHKYGVSPYPDFVPWQSAAPAAALPAAAESGQTQGASADQHGQAASLHHHMQQQQDNPQQQQQQDNTQQQQQHPLPGAPAGQVLPQPVHREATPAAAADQKFPEQPTTIPPTGTQPLAADQAPPPAHAPAPEAAAPSRPQRPPPVRRLLNLAELSDGASVLAANLEARRPERAIDRDVDSFMKNDCDAEKWMMIELSQLGTVETIKLTMKELYSSRVHTFRVLGRASHPRKDSPDLTSSLSSGSWQLLGSFTAENKRGTQSFSLPQRSRVRYLLLMFDTHYGNEQMCAMNCIEVLGVSAAQELEEALALHEQETEQDEHLHAALQHQHILPAAGQTDHLLHHQNHHQPQQQQQPEYHDRPNSSSQSQPSQSHQSHQQQHQEQQAHTLLTGSGTQDQALQASQLQQQQQLTAEGAIVDPRQGHSTPTASSTAVQTGPPEPAAAVQPPADVDASRQDVHPPAQQPDTSSPAAAAADNGSSSAHYTGQQQQQQQQPPHTQTPSAVKVPVVPELSQHEPGSVLPHDILNSAAAAADAALHTPSASPNSSSTPVLLDSGGRPTGHPLPFTAGPGPLGSQGPGPQHTAGAADQGITQGAAAGQGGTTAQEAATAAGGAAAAPAQAVLVVPSSNIQQQHLATGDTGATGVSAGPDVSPSSIAAATSGGSAVQDTLAATSSLEHHGGGVGAAVTSDSAQQPRPAGANGGAGSMQQVTAATGPASSSAARETGSVLDSRGSNKPKQAGNLFDVIKSEMMQLKLEQGKLSKKVDALSKHTSEADGSLAGLQQQQASLAAQLERLTKRVDALAAAHATSAAAQQQLRKDVSALFAMQTERSKYTHRTGRHHAGDDVYTTPAEGVLHDVHVTAQPGSSLDMPRKPFLPPICARPAVEAAPLLMQSHYQWGVVTALASTSLMGLWVVLHPKSLGLPQALRLVVCVLALLNGILAILLGVWLLVMHGLHQHGATLLLRSPATSFPLHKMLSNGSSWEGPPY